MMQSSKAPSYRHWLEHPVLIFTLFVLATAPAVILLFFLSRWGGTITITLEAADRREELTLILLLLLGLALGVLAVFAAIGLITLWQARRRLNRLRRGSVRVSANQFPALHRLARQAAAALGVEATANEDAAGEDAAGEAVAHVYLYNPTHVRYGPGSIAVLGVRKPYFILISTFLVSDLAPGELVYLLGCQYGHIKLGHVRILTIIDGLSGGLGRVPLLGGFIRFVFLGWTRLAVFSADRAGLIAVRRLADAYGALVKLVVDSRYFAELNHQELALQARRTRGGMLGLISRTTMPFDTQPLGRFDRLVPFAVSPEFLAHCPDADLDFPYLECWR